MPRGSGPKREREYKKLVDDFKKEERYKGREEEVAARIVNKQRAQFGETKKAKSKEKKGQMSDQNLPIKRYHTLTISEVRHKMKKLSSDELKKVKAYEKEHKDRKTLLQEIDREIKKAA